MVYREILGGAAAGTLGFIYNNLKGVHRYTPYGIAAGRWRNRKMPPTNIKRKSTARKLPYPKKRKIGKSTRRRGKSTATYRRTRRSGSGRKSFGSRRRRAGRRNPLHSAKDPHALDASFSNARLGSGPRVFPGFKQRGIQNSFTSLVYTRIVCDPNQQKVAYLNSWQIGGTGTQESTVKTGKGFGINMEILQYMQRQLSRQQPQMYQANTAAPNPAQQTAESTLRFTVNGLYLTHEIKNVSNYTIKVDLYDVVARANQSNTQREDPLVAWNTGMKEEQEYGVSSIPGGSTAATTGNTGWISTVGVTPFKSKRFCRAWRVIKVTRLMIKEGHTHIHKVNVKPRNMFTLDPAQLNNFENFPGLTHATFAVVRGGITNESDTAAITANAGVAAVGYGAGGIDVVTKAAAYFSLYEKSRAIRNHFQLLPVLVAPRIMQDDSATAVAVSVA